MATHKFVFHSDPGHGWLAVKRTLLADMGILTQISRCSYQRGGTVYLEEDQDVGTFFTAYRALFHCDPIVVPSRDQRGYRTDSRVRSYARFSPT